MIFIALIAVIGVLLLQWTDSIPPGSVGGSLTIGFTYIAAALAVGIHEAWTKKRGVLGWMVNIVVSFVGVLLAAQLGGIVLVMLLSPFTTGSSIAATGGAVMSISLVGGMLFSLLGAWGALQLVNKWRDRPKQANPNSLQP